MGQTSGGSRESLLQLDPLWIATLTGHWMMSCSAETQEEMDQVPEETLQGFSPPYRVIGDSDLAFVVERRWNILSRS